MIKMSGYSGTHRGGSSNTGSVGSNAGYEFIIDTNPVSASNYPPPTMLSAAAAAAAAPTVSYHHNHSPFGLDLHHTPGAPLLGADSFYDSAILHALLDHVDPLMPHIPGSLPGHSPLDIGVGGDVSTLAALTSTTATSTTASTSSVAPPPVKRARRRRNPFETEEERLMRKRERKRESVRKSRRKKQERLDHLESRTKQLEQEKKALLKTIEKASAVIPSDSGVKEEIELIKQREKDAVENGENDSDDSSSKEEEYLQQREDKLKTLLVKAVSYFTLPTFDQFEAMCNQFYDENVIALHPDMSGEIVGRKNVMKWWRKLVEAFPDCKISTSISREDRKGNQFKIHFTVSGTHLESIFGIMPSNKFIRTSGHCLMSFEGERIVKQVLIWNHGNVILEMLGIPSVDIDI